MRIGLIAVNPCKDVSPPRLARHDIPSIGPDDLSKLLSAIRQSSYYLYYHMLLTGLRRSELLALKWKDIDLELACIYVLIAFTDSMMARSLSKSQRLPEAGAL